MSLNLVNRRILVTEVLEGIGNDLIRSLISKKAIVIAFVKTTEQLKDLENAYPNLILILLDVSKCAEDSQKILGKLPYLDHIVNLSGPIFDKLLGCLLKHYRPETADIRTTKADDIVSKLVLGGSRSMVVNFSDTGGSTNFSGSSASLAASQLTSALRSSIRKLFRGKSTEPTSNSTPPKSHETAKKSATLPLTSSSSPPVAATTTPTRRSSFRFLGFRKSQNDGTPLKSDDDKLKKSLTKIHKEFRKKWEKKLKKIKSNEVKQLADLQRQMEKFMKDEIASANASNVAVNATTLSRADALSPETANKIVASRERKARKDASRLADRKFEDKKKKLEDSFKLDLAAAVEKHYGKVVKREIQFFEKRAKKARKGS